MRMGWLFGRNNVRAPWIVALLVLVNALLLRALDPAGLTRLRDVAFDSFQRIKPRTYHPATPVRIVDIDEAALAEFGQWPWPRTIVGRLIDKLTEKGAAVIAFDVVFAEPDRSSISRMIKDLVAYADAATVQKLTAAIQDNDKVLADVDSEIARGAWVSASTRTAARSRRSGCSARPSPATIRASSCRCSRAP